jgi:hypothetical protein
MAWRGVDRRDALTGGRTVPALGRWDCDCGDGRRMLIDATGRGPSSTLRGEAPRDEDAPEPLGSNSEDNRPRPADVPLTDPTALDVRVSTEAGAEFALRTTSGEGTKRRTGLFRNSEDSNDGVLAKVLPLEAGAGAGAVVPRLRCADAERTGDVRRATGERCDAMVRW